MRLLYSTSLYFPNKEQPSRKTLENKRADMGLFIGGGYKKSPLILAGGFEFEQVR
jgi:hypothetical protein